MSDAAIVTAGLGRAFRVRRRAEGSRFRRQVSVVEAVRDVNVHVARGEMVGYIGPNGAGKSTTIKMLTGILAPTSGRAEVAGLDPRHQRRELARRIGVVFGQRSQLWWDLPLADSFSLLRHIYRVPEERHRRRLGELSELFALRELLPVPVRQLSLGQRMRGELAAALLHEPEVVFLDEPTIGLDVVSKQAVRDALAALNRAGVTIVLTTHDLADIEHLCERLLIIDHGRLIYDGGLESLKATYGPTRTLVVDLDTVAPPLQIDGVMEVHAEGHRQWLTFRRDELTASQLLARVAALAPIADLTVEEPAIEAIVADIYRTGRART